MGPKNYRLGEHKIIESATGELRWEAHCGFTEFHEGACFRKGAILFLGPAENEQAGFLKGDFLDHIKAFPVWSKTRYYCSAFDIYHCDTGKRVAKQEMMMWTISRRSGEEAWTPKEGAFRLGRHQITTKGMGQIRWKTAPGPNAISQGECAVLEGILFFWPGETTESNSIGRRFDKNLDQLSKWDQTTYFCHKSSLFDCRSWNKPKEATKTRSRSRRAMEKHDGAGKAGKCIRFRPAGLGAWKRQTVIFFRWVKIFVISLFRALGLIISFCFAIAIRFRKRLKE